LFTTFKYCEVLCTYILKCYCFSGSDTIRGNWPHFNSECNYFDVFLHDVQNTICTDPIQKICAKLMSLMLSSETAMAFHLHASSISLWIIRRHSSYHYILLLSFFLRLFVVLKALLFTVGLLGLSQLYQSPVSHRFQGSSWAFSASMAVLQIATTSR
jgi:hypothetical protein